MFQVQSLTLKTSSNALLWIVATLVVTGVIVTLCLKYYAGVEGLIRSAGLAGPLISILLYSAFALTPIPSDSLTVLNGLIFGPIGGILISWLGNNGAAFAEYYIGKSINSVSHFSNRRHKLPWGLGKFPVHSAWFLLIGRFVPGYGGKVVSLLAGMYDVPLWTYVWTTLVTNLLGSVLFALVGHSLIKIF